ncbi:MAG TPA: hypothetical protein VF017_02045 [Thermoanaerobaculia bacterium]|nr:hypothetical protein [Thermoanaerobaculia bacterium]
MRPEVAAADRAQEVREAARGWSRAGAISQEQLSAIEAAFPDDRSRVSRTFRVLLFVFTFLAVQAAFGFAVLLFEPFGRDAPLTVLLFLFGLGLSVLTEVQTGPLRRAQAGAEEATALLAPAFLIALAFWVGEDTLDLDGGTLTWWVLGSTAVFCGLASWRWGSLLSAGVATASLFLLLARQPAPRLAWIPAALVLLGAALRSQALASLAPAHRRALLVAAGVGIVALYVAVHLGSFDSGLVETVGALGGPRTGETRPSPTWRWLALLGTTLVPAGLLALGVLARRRWLLALGLAATAASLVTFHHYRHLLPVWANLVLVGGVLVIGVLGLRRWLEAGDGRQRRGFTARPLFDLDTDRQPLEIAATAAVLAPEARATPEEPPSFRGGGGEMGGGGASSTF